MAEEKLCPCHKTKVRDDKEYKDLLNRLNRIEGQIRGIKGMVERDAYCPDILIQVAAANAALNSFNKVLLANHIKTCVTTDIKDGKEETVDELVKVLQKLMKKTQDNQFITGNCQRKLIYLRQVTDNES